MDSHIEFKLDDLAGLLSSVDNFAIIDISGNMHADSADNQAQHLPIDQEHYGGPQSDAFCIIS
jgi:hypothetical protein